MTGTAKACPFCGSTDTVKEADFATSLMVNRHHCNHCRSFFEAIKWGDPGNELDLPAFLKQRDTAP
jgi:hypothetical protein